jgi:methylmalonyl-CoA/ethylmalonyl-CoA epimerase
MGAPGPLPVIGFHHFAISVPDMDAAIDWYGRMFGFAEEMRFTIPGADTDVVMLKSGAMRLEIFKVADAVPLPADRRDPRADIATHGNKHAAFAVADLAAVLAQFRALGGDIAFVGNEGPQKIAFVRDPVGNLIELVEAV